MNNWIILHTNSKLSHMLCEVLGVRALQIDLQKLINETEVKVCLQALPHHRWTVGGQLISNIQEFYIYHEVFHHIGLGLDQYFDQDHDYVRCSWQAYLISFLSSANFVLNPVKPQSLTISHYQFPNLFIMAKRCGFLVPSYEIGQPFTKEGILTNSLWFSPYVEPQQNGIINIQLEGSEWLTVRFVRNSINCFNCWPNVPRPIFNRLLEYCSMMEVHIGEVYFRVDSCWWFYGLKPRITTDSLDEATLEEIAICIRNIRKQK